MARFDALSALVPLRAMAAFSHLNHLDDLWTLYLREPGEVSAEQANALDQITGGMRDVLARAGDHAERLQALIRQQQDAFEKASQLILRSTPVAVELDPTQRDDIEQLVRTEGGFTPLAIRQLAVIRELSWPESESLEAKMALIRQHGISEGDLGQRFKCALLVSLLAASIAAMVSTGMILFPPVMAALAGGAPASTVVSLFVAHHGAGFMLEAVHAAIGLAHSVKKCFGR